MHQERQRCAPRDPYYDCPPQQLQSKSAHTPCLINDYSTLLVCEKYFLRKILWKTGYDLYYKR